MPSTTSTPRGCSLITRERDWTLWPVGVSTFTTPTLVHLKECALRVVMFVVRGCYLEQIGACTMTSLQPVSTSAVHRRPSTRNCTTGNTPFSALRRRALALTHPLRRHFPSAGILLRNALADHSSNTYEGAVAHLLVASQAGSVLAFLSVFHQQLHVHHLGQPGHDSTHSISQVPLLLILHEWYGESLQANLLQMHMPAHGPEHHQKGCQSS